jgi:hypothetical protein
VIKYLSLVVIVALVIYSGGAFDLLVTVPFFPATLPVKPSVQKEK